MKNLFPLATFVFSLHISIFAQADLTYIDPNAIDIETALSAPPKSGSEEEQKDFNQLLNYQNQRTAAECQRASGAVKVKLENFYGEPYGPLSQKQIDLVEDFLKTVRFETSFFVHQIKDYWDRPRPYEANSNIKPCIALEWSSSYPSGHTALAHVYAKILVYIFPNKKEEILRRADEISTDRVLGGVHHPTDIEAGKKIAGQLFEEFMKSKKFVKKLNAFID